MGCERCKEFYGLWRRSSEDALVLGGLLEDALEILEEIPPLLECVKPQDDSHPYMNNLLGAQEYIREFLEEANDELYEDAKRGEEL